MRGGAANARPTPEPGPCAASQPLGATARPAPRAPRAPRTGEQRRRHYDWSGAAGGAGLDPASHRFGLSGAEAGRRRGREQLATMRQILQPELDEGVEVGARVQQSHARTECWRYVCGQRAVQPPASSPTNAHSKQLRRTESSRPQHALQTPPTLWNRAACTPQHAPAVVPALLRDHQLARGDALGRARPAGAGGAALPAGHVFGAASAREAEPCVGELIR